MESFNKKMLIHASIVLAVFVVLSAGSTFYFYKKSQGHIDQKAQEQTVMNSLLEELQDIKKIINTILQHQVQAINREIVQARNNNQQQRPAQQEQSSCRHAAQPQESARASHEKVTEIATKDDLQSLLDTNNKPSVLFFHMNGCGWCKKMDPVFDEVSKNPAFGKIKFYRIEGRSSQAGELVQKAFDQKITGFPTLLFVNNGKFIDKQVGFAQKDDFEANIKKNLQN